MTTYYVDTSALVKRYIDELGSDWVRAVFSQAPLPSMIVVHLALVEMTSALARRQREGILTQAEYPEYRMRSGSTA